MIQAAVLEPKSAGLPKRVTVLGSTGSVGTHTVALLAAHRSQFAVEALTAYDNCELLIEQALSLRPRLAVIGNEKHYEQLKTALAGTGIDTAAGEKAVCEAAARPAELVVTGIVGAAGLKPTLEAIRQGTSVAVVNKEPLVCAGELLMREAKQHNARILPVDSEHNAIFQVFCFEQVEHISHITLTASGGPFREWTLQQMREATPEEAVRHPNWSMGAKISVDSATMINKGLEIIEAYHLFPLEPEQIQVVVHPQSVVHGMVHYRDGSVLAQLGPADMAVPIAHALAWPQRLDSGVQPLHIAEISRLDFHEPDTARFPGLALARQVLQSGGAAPIYYNGANEVAVARFLNRDIGFLDITSLIDDCLSRAPQEKINSLDDIIAADAEVRRKAASYPSRG